MSAKFKRWLKGAYRSWSMRVSAIAAVLGGMEHYSGFMTTVLGPKTAGAMIFVGGLAGMYLRARTDKSLEERGK